MNSIKEWVGLSTVRADTEEVLDLKGSMFRFVCLTHAPMFYALANGFFFVLTFIFLLMTAFEYQEQCLSEQTTTARRCQATVVFEGTFLGAMGCTLFFFLNFINGISYRHEITIDAQHPPLLIQLQWFLYASLLSTSICGSVAFDELLNQDVSQDIPMYRGFVLTSCVFMVFDAVFGLYEMNFRHLVLSTNTLLTYYGIASIISQVSDKPLYPKMKGDIALKLVLLNLGIHTIFIGFQMLKIRRKFYTNWKQVATKPAEDGSEMT